MGGLVGDLSLGRLAIAYLPHGAHRPENRAVVIAQHRDSDLDQEVSAIERPLRELAVPPSLPRHDACDLIDADLADGVEHIEQVQEIVPDGILTGDAVELLSGRICKRHPAGGVGGDDGVGHMLEDPPEIALRLAIGG